MLVLMDMEWIENKTHFFCPTQIAAMRVDENWNCVDRFEALIKPFDKSCQRFQHIAYSGAEPEKFLSASAGPLVLLNLFNWLYPDDILCWWNDQPALVFQNVVGNLLHRNVDHSMCVIYTVWQKLAVDGHLMVGSPYRLALDRLIPVPSVEHASANDVEAIRALLQATNISQEAVSHSIIDPNAKIKRQANFLKEKKKNHSATANTQQFPLYYDDKKKLLHKATCPDISNPADLQGFMTYKVCIQQGLKPCRCCRDEYWQENWRLSQEIIQSCRYNYIHGLNQSTFHRTSCIHAKRIPFMDLRGGIYYANCLKNGLEPCRWCKPSIKQQIDPPHTYHKHMHASSNKDCYDSEWNTTRRLTRDEKVALRRHDEARKERIALQSDQRVKTKTELHDEHILTQTRYAFWNAVGYQNFHLRNCEKLNHLSDLHGYARFQDAIKAGLTPCRECKPSPKFDIKVSVPIYQRERQNESVDVLDRLCDEQGFLHFYTAPDYYIETTVGKWRLDTSSQPIDVFHINLVLTPDTTYYHKQHRLFLSLADTFEYIKRHDLSLMEKIKDKMD